MCPARPEDRRWLAAAIELSKRCQPSDRAYSVGALIIGAEGEQLASGYSRETDALAHAEEAALGKLAGSGVTLVRATLYTSLEPCSRRASRPRSCTRLILDSGVGRVVLAWREPPVFVADARGAELLIEAGVEVVELPELADAARAVNAHLLR